VARLAIDIAKELAAQVAGCVYDDTGTTGNLFIDVMPETPGTAIAVWEYGGTESDAKLGYDEASVQIKVRSIPQTPTTAYDLVKLIYDHMHGLSKTLPDGTVLIHCVAVTPPQSLGEDDSNRHHQVVNFRCEVRNTAGGRQ